MRHQKKRHKLGRSASHRKATLAALSNALIEHKRITTTVAKAKALRIFIEPLITRCKEDTTHNRRQVFRRLQNKHSVTTLFTDVSTKVGERPGGYTRVVKLGRRAGDGAALAVIELVDYNDVRPDGDGTGRKRTRRGAGRGRRRSRGPEAVQPKESTDKPAAPVESVEDVAPAAAVDRVEAEDTETVSAEAVEDIEAPVEETEAVEAPAAVDEAEAPAAVDEIETPPADDEAETPAAVDEAEAPAAVEDVEIPEAAADVEAPESVDDAETVAPPEAAAGDVEEVVDESESAEPAAEEPKSEKPQADAPASDEEGADEKKDQ